MSSGQLQNSQSSRSLDRQVEGYQLANGHLKKMTDNYIDYFSELMNQIDPTKQYETIISRRLKEKKDLQDKNIKLINQNKMLVQELTKLKNLSLQAGQNQESSNVIRQQPFMNENSLMANKQEKNCQYEVKPSDMQQHLKQSQQLVQNARQQENSLEGQFVKIELFMETVFKQAKRILNLQKVDKKQIENPKLSMVNISRDKYNLLLNFYIQSTAQSHIFNTSLAKAQREVHHFSEQNKVNSILTKELSPLLNIREIEKQFQILADKAQLKEQWEFYLKNRGNQAQKILTEIQTIVKGPNDKQSKIIVQNQVRPIQQNSNLPNQTQDASTIFNQTNVIQGGIEHILFKKIRFLLTKLDFSDEEIQLFDKFDVKRKMQRLFDVSEFIKKFKNKQDLVEVSKGYSDYLIKTINQLMISLMRSFTDYTQKKNAPTQNSHGWFMKKLDIASQTLKNRVFAAIQKQFNQYLEDKYPQKSSNDEEYQQTTQIKTPQFDKDKLLRNELLTVVSEYKKLFDSSVFQCSRAINVLI